MWFVFVNLVAFVTIKQLTVLTPDISEASSRKIHMIWCQINVVTTVVFRHIANMWIIPVYCPAYNDQHSARKFLDTFHYIMNSPTPATSQVVMDALSHGWKCSHCSFLNFWNNEHYLKHWKIHKELIEQTMNIGSLSQNNFTMVYAKCLFNSGVRIQNLK